VCQLSSTWKNIICHAVLYKTYPKYLVMLADFVTYCRLHVMDDKLPQVTATHKDSGDYAEQVESHVSTAAHTGKKSHLLNYLVVQKSS